MVDRAPVDPDSERRLSQVDQRLRELSPGWNGPWGSNNQRAVERLEDERRELRARLGLPQIDPPRQVPLSGWLILFGAIAGIFGIACLLLLR